MFNTSSVFLDKGEMYNKGGEVMLVLEHLANYAATTPDHEAVVFEDRVWTYKELFEASKKVAQQLAEVGVQKGDIVAQFMLNSDYFMIVYYGIQLTGATVMPVNNKLAPPEVDYIFMHSQARVLIADEQLQHTLDATTHAFEHRFMRADIVAAVAQEEPSTFEVVENKADDIAVIMYTSGTTGKPKGVMMSHRNVIETAEIWSLSMDLVPQDRTYICTPLFHCAGSHVFAVPTMINGGTLVVGEAFSPDKTLKDLVDYKATIFFGVPAMYTILLSKSEMKTYSFDTLRIFGYGAAPMPYELIKQLKDTFPNVKVQNFYGQTENSPATSTLLDEYAMTKIGSVGRPLARTELKIVDANGDEVPIGEVGEICVKGPQIMQGYLRNPEETSKTIIGDWLHSGDLGRLDDEGFLYIVDRKKDMIIRGGENIYPIEVEEVLYQIPQVLEAAIVGVPHEVYGEVPKAFVVVKDGETLTEGDVLAYCATQLAKYKLPYEVDFLQALPRNASGKVLKHTLRPKQTT